MSTELKNRARSILSKGAGALTDAERTELASIERALTAGGTRDNQRAEDDARRERHRTRLTAESGVRLTARHRANAGNLRAFNGHDAVDRAFLAGQYFRASLFGDQRAATWLSANTQGASIGPDGGFLVSTELAKAIIDVRERYGVFRANAQILPMASNNLQAPLVRSDLSAAFASEGADLTFSTATWGLVNLVARKFYVLLKTSAELAENAIGLADSLTLSIGRAFAKAEDEAGFLGDGGPDYGGIAGLATRVGAGSTVTAATGNTAFATLDLADFEAMVGKLPNYASTGPKWYINRKAWAGSMLRLQNGRPDYQVIDGVAKPYFLGCPVEFVNAINSTLTAQPSTSGLCYFGDLALAAVFGDRHAQQVERTPDEALPFGLDTAAHGAGFLDDEIYIRARQRFDIACHNVGDATDPGAIVQLATPEA